MARPSSWGTPNVCWSCTTVADVTLKIDPGGALVATPRGVWSLARVDPRRTRTVSDPRPDDFQPSDDDLAAVGRLKEAFAKLKAEMAKVIVGQHAVLEELM